MIRKIAANPTPRIIMHKPKSNNLSASLDKLQNYILEEEKNNNYGYLPVDIRNSIEAKIAELKEKSKNTSDKNKKDLCSVIDRVTYPGNDTVSMYIALGKVEKTLAEG